MLITPCILSILLLAVLLATVRSASAIELRRGPFLMNQRPDGITIRWRTSDAARYTSVVRYGKTPCSLDKAVPAREIGGHFPGVQEWEAVLRDLEADTRYHYAVEADQVTLAGADPRHHFRTAPSRDSSRRLRFWLFGDCGSNRPREGDMDAVLNMGGPSPAVRVRNGFRLFNRGRNLDGIIPLGDNAGPFGTDAQYQTAFFGLYADELCHTTLWPCAGNHNLDGAYRYIFFSNAVNPVEISGIGPGDRYYYGFDVGNVHFVVLEAWKSWWEVTMDPDYQPWREELAWLHQDLRSTDREWIVVICHFPLYCDGNYNSDTNAPLKLLRETLVPVLDEYGVDLYISGHDHTYQRSYLLHGHSGERASFLPQVHAKSPSTGRDEPIRKPLGSHSGTMYIVSGTGGGSRPGVTFAHPAMIPFGTGENAPRGLAEPGSLLLEIEGKVLQGWQIETNGQAADHFTIEKTEGD